MMQAKIHMPRWMIMLLCLLPLPVQAAESVLVLPVMKDEKGSYLLWESDNHWRQAWEKNLGRRQNTGVILPLGDLDDVQQASADAVVAGDKDTLAALATRYGVKSVMVSEATYRNGRMSVKLDNDSVDFTGKEAQAVNSALQDIKDQVAAAEVAEIAPAAGEVTISEVHTMQAVFPLESLSGWVKTKEKLKAVSAIKDYKTMEVTTAFVKLELTYNGSIESFRDDLRSSGFALEQQGNDWTLKPL